MTRIRKKGNASTLLGFLSFWSRFGLRIAESGSELRGKSSSAGTFEEGFLGWGTQKLTFRKEESATINPAHLPNPRRPEALNRLSPLPLFATNVYIRG